MGPQNADAYPKKCLLLKRQDHGPCLCQEAGRMDQPKFLVQTCLDMWWDFWGCPVQSEDMDLMILAHPFQPRIFDDSRIQTSPVSLLKPTMLYF